MKIRFTLPAALLALVLECIPYGIRMRWMAPETEEYHITWHAYFSMMPFGYGDIFPLVTSVLTVLLILSILLYLWIDELETGVKGLSFLASAASVIELGFQVFLHGYISPIGIAVTALLVFITVLNFRKVKEQTNG